MISNIFPTSVGWTAAGDFDLVKLRQEFAANIDAIDGACVAVDQAEYTSPRLTSEYMVKDIVSELNLTQCAQMIDRAVQDYVATLGSNSTPTRAKSWIDRVEHTQGHPWHAHAPADVSGTLYLRVGAGGHLEFRSPNPYSRAGYFPQLYEATPVVQRTPRQGDCGVWPSWLEHRVTPVQSDEPRYAISFDYVVPKGPAANT